MALDQSTLQMIGRKVHGLTRHYEKEQNCKRKTVVTVAFRRWNGGVHELSHWVNGPLFGDPTRCTDQVGGCGCLHSEVQAICALLRGGYHLQPGELILAVTYSPCTPCAHVIGASQAIRQIYWLEDTAHDMRGIDILFETLGKAEKIIRA